MIKKYENRKEYQFFIDIFDDDDRFKFGFDTTYVYSCFDNASISNLIGINVDEYEKIMIEEFNGNRSCDIICKYEKIIFIDEEMFNKAIEWLESALTIKKLIGE